jgi:hypothetical protein
MKINQLINETTTAGAIATVEAPMNGMASRYPKVKGIQTVNKLMKGKTKKKGPYANSMVSENKMKRSLNDLREEELSEDDLIIVPGQNKARGFIPKQDVRTDREVEMAKGDLFQCIKNAKTIFEMITDISEEDGIEGWVQEKIIKASDYLNTVREYMEQKRFANEMTGGVIGNGMAGESIYEGKMKDLVYDLEDPELSEKHFKQLYGMSRREAREAFSKTNQWDFPEHRDHDKPLHEQGLDRRITIGPDGKPTGGWKPNPVDPNAPPNPEEVARIQQRQQYDAAYNNWLDTRPVNSEGRQLPGTLDVAIIQRVLQGEDPNELITGRSQKGAFGSDPSKYQALAKQWLDWKGKEPKKPNDMYENKGVGEGLTNDYFKRRKDEEDRIAGTKAPTKRTPQQTDYAKRRAQEKKVEQGVAEGFDQPYPLKWETSEYGDIDALAKLPDGSPLSIMFNLADMSENDWGVEFHRNNSQSVTGEGDAQRVFATVLNAIGKFIKKKKPDTLFFTAVKEEDPTGSREKLYDRLVQRYATGLGYNLKKVDYSEQTGYKLIRKEQGVAESKSEVTCGCGPECTHCGGKHSRNEVGKKCSCCGNMIKLGVGEGWSQKYKDSINCSHPKGFSQKAHCAGKKKHNESITMETGKQPKKNPYAIGMAQAMKSTGDQPPLKKSTITKAHEIAKSIKNKG